jgi:hypothetical protein
MGRMKSLRSSAAEGLGDELARAGDGRPLDQPRPQVVGPCPVAGHGVVQFGDLVVGELHGWGPPIIRRPAGGQQLGDTGGDERRPGEHGQGQQAADVVGQYEHPEEDPEDAEDEEQPPVPGQLVDDGPGPGVAPGVGQGDVGHGDPFLEACTAAGAWSPDR